MEGFTYEVYATTDTETWTLRGSAVVVDGWGLFVEPAASDLDTEYEVCVTLHGESEPPIWPADAQFTTVACDANGVQVEWSAAHDDRGVAGYAIYLDGNHYATMGPEAGTFKAQGCLSWTSASSRLRFWDVHTKTAS